MFWKKKPPISLDDVTFDTSGLTARDAPQGVRAWTTPDGDGLGLYVFDIPPDLPRGADMAKLRAFYEDMVGGPSGLVELATFRLDGLKAVRVIVKMPQQPTGLTFVASLTLPFRDCSFVAKVQCAERGTTGIRESILLATHMAGGGEQVTNADGTLAFPGFEPYDRKHDDAFAQHPLSRARRVMERVAASLRVTTALREQPEFDGVIH